MSEVESSPATRIPGRFEVFYRDEYRRVVAVTTALVRNRWVAEDIAQEAFLRAHRDWDRVGRFSAPGAWVRRVAVNLATSRFRRLRAELAARARLGPARADHQPPPPPEVEAFWDEVRRLPSRQAQAVALFYVEDLSVAEVAGVLGVADGTVKALLHQARTRLAERLAAKGWVER